MLRFVKTNDLADRDIIFKSATDSATHLRKVLDPVNPDIAGDYDWADYHLDVKRLVEQVTNHEYRWHWDVWQNFQIVNESAFDYPSSTIVEDFSGVSFPTPYHNDGGPSLSRFATLTQWDASATTYTNGDMVWVQPGTSHLGSDPWFLCIVDGGFAPVGVTPSAAPASWRSATIGNQWLVHSNFTNTSLGLGYHRYWQADIMPSLTGSAPSIHHVNEDVTGLIAICPNWKSLVASGSSDSRAQVISGMKYWENLMWDLNSAKGIGYSSRRLFFCDNTNLYPFIRTFNLEDDLALKDMRITQGNYWPPGDNTMDCGFAVNFHVYDPLSLDIYSPSFGMPGVDMPYSNNVGNAPQDMAPGPTYTWASGSRPSTGNWSQTFTDEFGNSFTLNLHGWKASFDFLALVTYVPS